MGMEKNSTKYPAAHATILAAVEAASDAWTGIDWDSGPQMMVTALERAIKRGASVDADQIDGGTYWDDNGSRESQELDREWQDLLSDAEDTDEADLLTRAQELAGAEAAAVAARAEAAAELGHISAAHVAAGEWNDAIKAAEQAAGIEREFGDAPAWGRLADEIRRLPEFVAAESAKAEYQDDVRTDDEIAAMADDIASGKLVCESLEALINSAGSDKLGRTDANADEWDDRYVATYTAELRDWCAA